MLAIIMELQRKRVLRAEDLAGTFETSVRTIYRDIEALCEAGVPVVGADAVVLEPEYFRNQVREIIKDMLKRY